MIRLNFIFLVCVLPWVSACLDGHDNKAKVDMRANFSSDNPIVITSVDSNQFKVKLEGYTILLFEINQRLLFERLVYANDKAICVANSPLTVAGGKTSQNCSTNTPEEIKLVRECIEIEVETLEEEVKYKLNTKDAEGNISISCDAITTDGKLPNSITIAHLANSASTLPEGYTFDASNITAENIKTALQLSSLCDVTGSLEFDDDKYTCTCDPSKPINPIANPFLAGIFINNPTCSSEHSLTSHLLKPLASPAAPNAQQATPK